MGDRLHSFGLYQAPVAFNQEGVIYIHPEGIVNSAEKKGCLIHKKSALGGFAIHPAIFEGALTKHGPRSLRWELKLGHYQNSQESRRNGEEK